MNTNKNSSVDGGIGFFGLLTIVFIVLKLIGVIDWPWIWVLAPIWLPFAIVLVVLLIAVVVVFIKNCKKGD